MVYTDNVVERTPEIISYFARTIWSHLNVALEMRKSDWIPFRLA